MRLQRIIEQVYLRPWLITPEAHASIRKVVAAKLYNPQNELFEDFIVQREPMTINEEGIARIDIRGITGLGLSRIEKTCGNTDTMDIAADIDIAQEAGAAAYLFHFDSPGGMHVGNPEIADKIASIAQPKASFTRSLMASAAYWMAAATDRIFATKSAMVGSIGSYIPWMDETAAYDMAGLKLDPIVNKEGDLKTTGTPGLQLTEAQREYWQNMVDQAFTDFKDFVLSHRDVPEEAMRGQVLSGNAALKANLIDKIGDESTAMKWLTGQIKANARRTN